jgi:hypothetical protein
MPLPKAPVAAATEPKTVVKVATLAVETQTRVRTIVLDLPLFRVMFPMFADTKAYPDALIAMFYGVAGNFISTVDCPCNILNGESLQYALYCMTAHLMYLTYPPGGTDDGMGVGGGGGFVTSASIGEVSVSVAQPPMKDGWEFWLGQSPFGQQLWALLSLKSVGGLYVGGLPERTGFRKVGGVFW